ncbi:MAG: hypothetical protein LJE59_06685 [Chromatiaceae bacterium]|jgi:hypothetical protein|nr:hypothetical protein [Chromatiaceae bacterium]
MPELPEALLSQLPDLIDRLRGETAGYLDQPGEQQLWYNRGYANGIVLSLQQLQQRGRLGTRVPDAAAVVTGHLGTPWGRAYRHGESMGSRETYEVTGDPAA